MAHLCLGSLERRCTSMRSRRSRRRLGMTCQTRIPPTNLSARSGQRVSLMSVSLSWGIGCSRKSIMLIKEACLYLDDWVIDAYEELELVPVRWTAAKKEGGVALSRFIKRVQLRREPRLARKCWAQAFQGTLVDCNTSCWSWVATFNREHWRERYGVGEVLLSSCLSWSSQEASACEYYFDVLVQQRLMSAMSRKRFCQSDEIE